MKLAVIGSGIFGMTIFIKLRNQGYDCYLFEKNNKILSGATTKNLNRIHFGYHYPRDSETIKQSIQGYKTFQKMYGKCIKKNFENYYAISKFSKVNAKSYLKIMKRNNLKLKIKKKLKGLSSKNLEAIYKVNEPIYSWSTLKSIVNKKIRKDANRIFLNSKIVSIKKKIGKYELLTKTKNREFDIVIDASYEGSNRLIKNISKQKKNLYQLTNVWEIKFLNNRKMGIAVMDGPFFSFLPSGHNNNVLLYHVKYSVVRRKISEEFIESWITEKKNKLLIKKNTLKIKNEIKKYFPNLKFVIIKKHISARVFETNTMKNSRRISYINEIKKNYFKIFSSKIDHSVDVANKLLRAIK